jgi:hypothetical protein
MEHKIAAINQKTISIGCHVSHKRKKTKQKQKQKTITKSNHQLKDSN